MPDQFLLSRPPRHVRPTATRQVITLTPARVDPAALAARIRALMVLNDPDAARAGLEEIAAALESLAAC